MRTDVVAALLAETPLFRRLDEKSLYRLAERAVERRFRKGEMIVRQDDVGDSLFVVVEGLIKVFVTSEHGEEMGLVTLKPRDVFGELALVDGGRRSASAITLEPTTVLVVGRPTLLEIMKETPSVAELLLQSMGALVRRLTEQAADLVFLDLHGRVAKLLLNLAERHGRKTNGEILLDLHMSQSDIATMVGGSRQSVNQTLRWFEQRGYLETRGREMVILRPDLLARRAGTEPS